MAPTLPLDSAFSFKFNVFTAGFFRLHLDEFSLYQMTEVIIGDE